MNCHSHGNGEAVSGPSADQKVFGAAPLPVFMMIGFISGGLPEIKNIGTENASAHHPANTAALAFSMIINHRAPEWVWIMRNSTK